MGGALLGVFVAACVCPLAQAGLDEAFGLAIGARRVGPGPEMAQAKSAHQAAEALGAVAGAVVGHDAGNPYPEAAVVAQRLKKRATGAGGALIRMQGAERYSAGIIDSHMDELPAGTVRALLAVARHAVARLAKAPQLLDVQMQQITGRRAFVAQHRWSRLQLCQTVETEPSKATRHRANGHARVVSYLSIGLACPTLRHKAIKQSLWGGMWADVRSRSAI